LNYLSQHSQNAVQLVELFAFLNPDEIRIDYLKHGRSGFNDDLVSLFKDDVMLVNCLAALESCSLVKVSGTATVLPFIVWFSL